METLLKSKPSGRVCWFDGRKEKMRTRAKNDRLFSEVGLVPPAIAASPNAEHEHALFEKNKTKNTFCPPSPSGWRDHGGLFRSRIRWGFAFVLCFFPCSVSPYCDLTDATRAVLVPIKLERDGDGW